MDFLQIVDPVTFASASVLRVLVELVVVAVAAVALGVGLRVVPERLVTLLKTPRPDRTAAAASARRLNTTVAAATATKSVPTPPAASKTVPTAIETRSTTAQAPATNLATAAPAAPVQAAASKADHTLDNALDSFFKDEDLLAEALLDTTVPKAEPVSVSMPNLPIAKPNSKMAKTSGAVPQLKNDTFSKELSAKMTKGLQGKAPAAPASKPTKPEAPAPYKTADTTETVDQKLDDALDAYLTEEQLLDEAILDSAVQEAQQLTK